MLYILDEPSIGLHQRDNDRLLATLRHLRDIGNSVLVVEHDEDTMRQADYLMDLGPGAGVRGGELVAAGTLEEVLANPVLRQGPQYIARAAALLAGIALPLALDRIIGPGRALLGGVLVATVAGATLLARLHGRIEGWRIAVGVLAISVLYAVVAR